AIAHAAESCMANLRGELGTLVPRAGPTPASEVLDRINALPARGVPRTLELEGDDTPLVQEVAEALVRIGPEAVTNAEQHSGCDRVTIRIVTLSPKAVTLQITDNGKYTKATPSPNHFGMQAMRSTAEQLAGKLTVHPAPVKGTLIQATLPTM